MTEQPSSSDKRSNKPLLLIVGIAALTTIVPFLMYLTGFGVPSDTTNEGILLSDPQVVSEFSFRDKDGQIWDLSQQPPLFRLVIPVFGPCDQACRETLYVTRQVHTRLSDKSEQVARLYVQLGERDGADFQQFLASEHPQLTYLRGDRQEWQSALAGEPELSASFEGGEYYLLHRYGALAMAYNEQHTGNQLLDDLEFLVKTSN